jgi:hypothetical protein
VSSDATREQRPNPRHTATSGVEGGGWWPGVDATAQKKTGSDWHGATADSPIVPRSRLLVGLRLHFADRQRCRSVENKSPSVCLYGGSRLENWAGFRALFRRGAGAEPGQELIHLRARSSSDGAEALKALRERDKARKGPRNKLVVKVFGATHAMLSVERPRSCTPRRRRRPHVRPRDRRL